METQIKKVQKWLGRCLIACRSGSWENALAEMECANAEMEVARKGLWAIVENEGNKDRSGIRSMLPNFVRAGVLAMFIVFASAMPVSRFNINVLFPEMDQDNHKVEFISTEEEVLLQALRQSLSENGFRETTFTDQGESSIIRRGTVEHVPEKGEVVILKGSSHNLSGRENQATTPTKKPFDLEELITLVQVGEEVLRESGPAIQIQR